MEVILLEKVQNLGDLGDLVNVKPGYARNYLVPQGKATFATEDNKAEFEQRRQALQQAAEQRLGEARARAEKLEGLVVEISRKASEEGKLFGSVSTVDISEVVSSDSGELEKSEIQLVEGPLKTVGEHEVGVSLHPGVNFNIKVIVVAEED